MKVIPNFQKKIFLAFFEAFHVSWDVSLTNSILLPLYNLCKEAEEAAKL
jgi:hypothetical protein